MSDLVPVPNITEEEDMVESANNMNNSRAFTSIEKTLLFMQSGGKCQLCHKKIGSKSFHADHIIPYSRGGATTIENGQALCAFCNLSKHANYDRKIHYKKIPDITTTEAKIARWKWICPLCNNDNVLYAQTRTKTSFCKHCEIQEVVIDFVWEDSL